MTGALISCFCWRINFKYLNISWLSSQKLNLLLQTLLILIHPSTKSVWWIKRNEPCHLLISSINSWIDISFVLTVCCNWLGMASSWQQSTRSTATQSLNLDKCLREASALIWPHPMIGDTQDQVLVGLASLYSDESANLLPCQYYNSPLYINFLAVPLGYVEQSNNSNWVHQTMA